MISSLIRKLIKQMQDGAADKSDDFDELTGFMSWNYAITQALSSLASAVDSQAAEISELRKEYQQLKKQLDSYRHQHQ